VTQQKIIGIPQVYSFSLKFEVHSFFGSLNVYVKERANTFQFASLGRKADSLLSAQLQPFASTPITIIFMRGTSVVLPSQSNN
jgi:hypothetical protein